MSPTTIGVSVGCLVAFMYLVWYIFHAPPQRSEDIIAMLLQVGLTALFLGFFFFTYVAKVEGDVTTAQINYIVDSFTKDVGSFLPPQSRPMVDGAIANMSVPDLSKEDELVGNNNQKLMDDGLQLLAIPCVISIIIFCAYFLVRPVRPSTLWLVLISLSAVAATYILFLNIVVKNYLTVDTNNIKKMIVEKLEKVATNAPSAPLPEIPSLPSFP